MGLPARLDKLRRMAEERRDFVNFEEALRRLRAAKVDEEQLKRFVSEGEIRAFRDGDTMKFRSEDIDALLSQALPPIESVQLWVDPGDASVEKLRELFKKLSDLHRAAEGTGLTFDDAETEVVEVAREFT